MRKSDRLIRELFGSASALLLMLFLSGCHGAGQAASTRIANTPQQQTPARKVDSEPTEDKTPIKDSLTALLQRDAQTDHIFPSGVQIKSVSVSDGVASIDFSHEFSELANSGETVESDAQHALRRELAQFKSVHKMRVTVDGKPFESQATDWDTPFSVRDSKSGGSRTKQPGISDSAQR